MGAWIAERWPPDRVLCSAAERTRQTWAGMAEAFSPEPEVEVHRVLYGAPPQGILQLVRHQPDTLGSVMVVGHNPGIQDLALRLTGGGDSRLVDRMERKFPTAAMAVFRFDTDGWDGTREGRGTLVDFVRPRDLPEA